MSLEQDLRTVLLSLDAVTAIVGEGAAARIEPDQFSEATFKTGSEGAAILIEVDDEPRENDIEGLGGLYFPIVNLKCRAWTLAEARALAEAIRTNGTDPGTGLAGYSGTLFDAVLDGVDRSVVPADDGSDRRFFDVDMGFTLIVKEDV